MRIAQETGHGHFIHRQRLGFDLGAASIGFFAQRLYRSDAQHVALELAVEAVVLQNYIQGLVPRHVVQHDGQRTVHGGIEHHVEAADLMDEPEEILQIHILQVH